MLLTKIWDRLRCPERCWACYILH